MTTKKSMTTNKINHKMEAKKKAKELVNKIKKIKIFISQEPTDIESTMERIDNDAIKECALIAVDEILKILPQSEYLEDRGEYDENRELIYWKQVKQEIEKLKQFIDF